MPYANWYADQPHFAGVYVVRWCTQKGLTCENCDRPARARRTGCRRGGCDRGAPATAPRRDPVPLPGGRPVDAGPFRRRASPAPWWRAGRSRLGPCGGSRRPSRLPRPATPPACSSWNPTTGCCCRSRAWRGHRLAIGAAEAGRPVRLPDRHRACGPAEKATHDYQRNSTTTLFAALEVATGKVTDRCYERHGKAEFLDFLKTVARAYPRRQLHVVCDNYHTHKHAEITAWLAKIRATLHFTPTSGSWLNMVEVFFGSSPARPSAAAPSTASRTHGRNPRVHRRRSPTHSSAQPRKSLGPLAFPAPPLVSSRERRRARRRRRA